MEILSNFSSAYCFISFILGALFMLTMLCIAAMGKVQESMDNVQEPMNNAPEQTSCVRFYVAMDDDGPIYLYMGKPIKKSDEFRPCYGGKVIAGLSDFSDYGLNPEDFNNMQEGEIREVFITLND